MKNKAQSLVELLVAMGILAIILPAVITALVVNNEDFLQETNRVQAIALLREAQEAVWSIRERGWENLVDGIYHPVVNGTFWDLVSGSEKVGNLAREIVIGSILRDNNGNIVESGGEIDYSTKKVTITVSWSTPFPASVQTVNYITRYLNNTNWLQTNQSEFEAGTTVNTRVVNNSGGEVELQTASSGNWTTPQVLTMVDFPDTADANSVFVVDNKAYVVTAARTGPDFYIYDVANPQAVQLLGSLDLVTTGYKVVVYGNFAFVATADNNRELIIIDVSNPALPKIASSFNTPTGADGRSVVISQNIAYLVTNNNTTGPGYELYLIDVTNPTNPLQISGLNLGGNSNDIFYNNGLVYIASALNSQELQLVNVANPQQPTILGTFNAPGTADGLSVFVVGDTTYLGAGATLYILNTSNPSSISQISTFSAGGIIYGIFVRDNLSFLVDGQLGSQFKVVEVSNLSSPYLYGSANLGDLGRGVFISGNYAYLATALDNGEFQIILGGSGGAFQLSGTFESQTFDCGLPTPPASIKCNNKAAFNYFTAFTFEPPNTSIKFKVAMKDLDTNWLETDFVGPDGTNNSFFDNSGSIPFTNPHRYFRFKAYFTSDGSGTPVLHDATLNYSP